MGNLQTIVSIAVKLVLFLSSYIPLSLIVILQMIRVSNDFLDNKKLTFVLSDYETWMNFFQLLYYEEILILVFVIILLLLALKIILRKSIDTNLLCDLEIKGINNISSHYITSYFAVYIFPFITLNMTTFDGIGTVLILISIIGYVYIKNDILYINPVLNILFKFNVYSIDISENKNVTEVILLSKKSRADLKINPSIKTYRIGYSVFIEL